ncbi:hypothetical protein EDF18_2412 [Frigoribacterium sp. PhB107]|uniref:amidohydrolase n=1 Tax=Frigoribacterium sp. PhB107 TaxID=2485172 RepID=UPI000F463920|nr:amidohydrolase [Frigoribacterium sp. PhB107]ROP75783.1 hypothetical protein EDF18_2412 [Frigoribacterium sp. PhB107]
MQQEARLVTVDRVWSGRWHGPSVVRVSPTAIHLVGAVDPGHGEHAAHGAHAELPHLPGTLFSPFTDSHVHLGLVDPEQLVQGGVGRVLDLGWSPDVAALWPERGRVDAGWPEVQVAGGLLCPPGGYPSGAGWAPGDASVVVADAADAERAVVRMRDLGASVVKLTLNSDVGPVFDDDVLRAIAVAADRVGLLTVAHVQGAGQVRRALDAGLLRFAHTPFSELLPDDLLDRAADGTWISTLDIHRGDEAQEVAIANLRGFRERGGHVLYGTDLGNGDLPVGVNERELRALQRVGLGREALLAALGSDDSLDAGQDGAHWTPRASWVPQPPPDDERDDPAWLARASVLTASTLQELLP